MAAPSKHLLSWLRIAGLAVGAAALLFALGWGFVDRRAPVWFERGLSGLRVDGMIAAGGVSMPSPDLVRLRDVTLRDPHDGRVVAAVDRVDVRLALVGGVPHPVQISGYGGQVVLERSAGEIGCVRALEAVIDAIGEALDDATPEAAPAGWRAPPVELHGLTLVFRAPGEATAPVADVTAWLAIAHDGVRAGIATGPAGVVLLDFDARGLVAVRAAGVPVGPVQTLLLDEDSAAAVAALRPRGVLDLELRLGRAPAAAHDRPSGHGVLRGARLAAPRLPWPATSDRIAFAIDGDEFRVESALVELPVGQADIGVLFDGERTLLRVDADGLAFRRELASLLLGDELPDTIVLSDGGRVDLHLLAELRDGTVSVTGSGGALLDALAPWRGGPAITDLVGRFRLTGDTLVLPEASGHCAGGAARLSGSLRLADRHADFALDVLDVDIGRLGLPLPEGRRAPSGWLQGALAWQGVPGRPGRGSGHFSVRGGNLWNIPVLDRVLGVLGLADPGASERHRLSVSFHTRGRTTTLDSLVIESDVVTLRGEGKLHHLRELDVEIVPLRLPVAVLGDLFEYLQSQVLKVELRGTLQEPEVRLRPFKAVTEPVGGILGRIARLFTGEADGVHIVPAPEESP